MRRLFLLMAVSLLLPRPALSAAESLFDGGVTFEMPDAPKKELRDFRGAPLVIAMAYTRCKSACPLTMQRLKKIEQLLKESGKHASILVVSLDPERDEPEDIANFKAHYKLAEPPWYVVRATSEQTRRLAVLLGISFQRDPASGEILHSNRIVLLDEEGGLLHALDGLASDVAALVDAIPAKHAP